MWKFNDRDGATVYYKNIMRSITCLQPNISHLYYTDFLYTFGISTTKMKEFKILSLAWTIDQRVGFWSRCCLTNILRKVNLSTVHIGLFHYIKVDTPISIALGYLMWHNSRLTEFCLWSLVLATYYCTSQPNNLWALFQSNQVSYNEK